MIAAAVWVGLVKWRPSDDRRHLIEGHRRQKHLSRSERIAESKLGEGYPLGGQQLDEQDVGQPAHDQVTPRPAGGGFGGELAQQRSQVSACGGALAGTCSRVGNSSGYAERRGRPTAELRMSSARPGLRSTTSPCASGSGGCPGSLIQP